MEGFRVQDFLGGFVNALKVMQPSLVGQLDAEYSSIDGVKESEFFKNVYRPVAMEFIKKDESLFTVPRMFLRGIDFSTFWRNLSSKDTEVVWDFLRTALVSSYIGEDWVKTLKDLYSSYTGKGTSEIDEILGDDSIKGGIEELFEFFKETKVFKLGLEIMENIKLEQFGLGELNLTDPIALLNMLKDPSNPIMARVMKVVGTFVENKIKNGSLRKEDIIAEAEMLAEKFKHSLGKIFQEGIFGTAPAETQAAAVLLSSHPDARRARMLARLQRKVSNKGK
jgi:hypothetical protein